MTQVLNRQILLAKRPIGLPASDDFQWVETPIRDLQPGEVLVRTLYVSVDPYMRGRMSEQKSYVPPYALGAPIEGGVISEVVESRNSDFTPGDVVLSGYGWQTHAVLSGKQMRKINPHLAPVSTALGVLGMPGLTAYFGLLDIGQPKPGETVVVSGAAGAVGMLVGQIAKIHGARVVGIAGSQTKIDVLTQELGFDAAVNYKSQSFRSELKAACPHGVDVYFDNVGGEVSDVVMRRLNHGARIPLCGQIAMYNLEKPDVGPRMQTMLLINSALMKGFIVSDYAPRFSEGIAQLALWYKEGKLKVQETVVEGFDNTVDAFLGLFRGENLGKQLVQVSE